MTRKDVYSVAFVVFLATFAMTLASIAVPRWVSYDSFDMTGDITHKLLGLHTRCTVQSDGSLHCTDFPIERECRLDRRFCSLWRTVGFLMSFTVVLQGMSLVAFVLLVSSGVQKRVIGRPVISGLLLLVAIVEILSMGIIAFLAEDEDKFFPGRKLDASWILCTSSWVVSLATAAGIWISAYVLPMEGDYELIPGTE